MCIRYSIVGWGRMGGGTPFLSGTFFTSSEIISCSPRSFDPPFWIPSVADRIFSLVSAYKHTHPRVKVSIVGSLRDREVACSASDRQGSNFESCVWRTVWFQSSHHPQEVLLAQFSLYVHKGGLKPDSFHLHTNTYPDCSNTGNMKTAKSVDTAYTYILWNILCFDLSMP